MKDARFGIPTPQLLTKAMDIIDQLPLDTKQDQKGDIYEYMLGKIASAGQNGQFRTPRHIIELMVALTAPTPKDVIVDPASGTCGFLVAASEYVTENHPDVLLDDTLREHFNSTMFNGFDFDNTMLRIGSMNMVLHGVENANIAYRDSLAEETDKDEGEYSLILANPPFSGSLDFDSCSKSLLHEVKTKKTELLFVALFMKMLKIGGRACVIVPSGVLESESSAHTKLRKTLLEKFRLEAIITLPHWVFKPYASVATAILVFSNSGKSEKVWFYKIENDGFDKGDQKLPVSGSELEKVRQLFQDSKTKNYKELKTKHRFVAVNEIVENDYDLCANVYLSGYEYPKDVPLIRLKDLFDIEKGTVPASSSNDGAYKFITSSVNTKRYNSWAHEGEAICIPIVSATGHGHASIKSIHYVNEKFSAATITAVLKPKDKSFYVPYVYYYLLAHKDDLLVPLMRGSANVSLNLSRLGKLRIPLPDQVSTQKSVVAELEKSKKNLFSLHDEIKHIEKNHSIQLETLKAIM